MSFINQHVIVTGGTRGIGAAISEAFLQRGAKVIATYVKNETQAKEFKERCAHPQNLSLYRFDVSQSNEVKTFFEFVEKNFPSLEVLVNNSGIREDELCMAMSEENWEKVINTNLNGTFYMCKNALPLFLKNRYGRIINMSSMSAFLGLPGQVNYSATKAGQIAMGKSLSKEVAKRGITVNAVAPGFIETELLQGLSSDQKKEYTQDIPMRRFGSAQEVAAAVLFLASREASYITGSVIQVSGGL